MSAHHRHGGWEEEELLSVVAEEGNMSPDSGSTMVVPITPTVTRRPVGRPPGSGRGRKRKQATETPKARPETVQYHCDYCQKDISGVVRIRCAVCSDFDLCVECFSVGVEIREHKNDHDYRIMDFMGFPLLEHGWGADEELLLLEAIGMKGMGNWSDIAEHVATKSAEECKRHYFKIYLEHESYPWPDTSNILTSNLEDYLRHRQDLIKKGEAKSLRSGDGLGAVQSPSKTLAKPNKKSKVKKQNVSQPIARQDLAGYMPKRVEFETEWENDAEHILADLTVENDEPEHTRELKYKLVDVYNWKLKERVHIRNFTIDNLLDLTPPGKKKQEKRGPKEEVEEEEKIRKDMQIFMQLHTKKQHDVFIEGLLMEQMLRKRIAELQGWRKNGLRTLQEAECYEADLKKRANYKASKLLGSSPYLMDRVNLPGGRWLSHRKSLIEPWDASPFPVSTSEGALPRAAKPAKKNALLDLTACPGLEMLTPKERELCAELHLYPQQYQLIKETLLRENLRNGCLLKSQAKKLVNIEPVKTGRVYDFMCRCGWI